jgi:hydroxyacylglutathione hydrolase
MKSQKKLFTKILIFVVFISTPLSLQTSTLKVEAQSYFNVSVHEAYILINSSISDPDFILLDVRTPEEYNTSHICNATLIPDYELESRLNELEPKDTSILVYCRSGGRSAAASQILADNGFTRVFNMIGGISEWISSGYEVCPPKNDQSSSTIAVSINYFIIIFLCASLMILLYLKKKTSKN